MAENEGKHWGRSLVVGKYFCRLGRDLSIFYHVEGKEPVERSR